MVPLLQQLDVRVLRSLLGFAARPTDRGQQADQRCAPARVHSSHLVMRCLLRGLYVGNTRQVVVRLHRRCHDARLSRANLDVTSSSVRASLSQGVVRTVGTGPSRRVPRPRSAIARRSRRAGLPGLAVAGDGQHGSAGSTPVAVNPRSASSATARPVQAAATPTTVSPGRRRSRS